VVRDRTKPVTLINDRVIMQDGKKIGIVYQGSAKPPQAVVTAFNYTSQEPEGFQVQLLNGRIIDLQKLSGGANYYHFDEKAYRPGEKLYNTSLLVKNKGTAGNENEYILRKVCYLIDNYAL
jgi:hypothetical protein